MREAGRRYGRRRGRTSAEQHENMSLLEMLPEVKTQDLVAPLPSLSNSVILFAAYQPAHAFEHLPTEALDVVLIVDVRRGVPQSRASIYLGFAP